MLKDYYPTPAMYETKYIVRDGKVLNKIVQLSEKYTI